MRAQPVEAIDDFGADGAVRETALAMHDDHVAGRRDDVGAHAEAVAARDQEIPVHRFDIDFPPARGLS